MRISEIKEPLPTIWYHSTEDDAVEVARDFRNHNIDPTGVVKGEEYWFSDDWDASRYYGPNTVVARLNFKNPLIVTSDEFRESRGGPSSYWAKKARNEGYDAVVIQDIMDGDMFSTVCAVFSVELIDAKPYAYWDEATQDFIKY
jgi:hypothetical protein